MIQRVVKPVVNRLDNR